MVKINSNDVLLGRGGNAFRHSGNKKFRELANILAKRYRDSSKLQKSEISKGMVHHVENLDPPGRFLKKNGKSDSWDEVDNMIAREKASQCLRDAVTALNLSDKKDLTSKPKAETTARPNTDESEDYSFGDDLMMIDKPPPMDYIAISDHKVSMKLPPNPPSYQRDDTTLLVPSDVMIRGHQMNQQQQALRIQQKNDTARVTFEEPKEVRPHPYEKYRGQAWSTSLGGRRARFSLRHQEHDQYLQNAYSRPFRSTPNFHQRANYPQPSSSFAERGALFPSQRVDDHLEYSAPSINKVSFDYPTSRSGIKTPEYHSPTATSKQIRMEMEQDEFQTPDRSIFKNFFDDMDVDLTSPYSCYSPEDKKLKKQRSFDDFNDLIKYCQSTSHSVDSIDSFAKSL